MLMQKLYLRLLRAFKCLYTVNATQLIDACNDCNKKHTWYLLNMLF